MQEPIQWLDDGSPYSERFDDVYRSRAGGLAQARYVFLQGCGMPQAWRGQKQWRVLETGFGLGLNFLATWGAWQLDEQRSEQLHFVSIEAYPVAAGELVKSAQALQAVTVDAALLEKVQTLSFDLSKAWEGVEPGVQTWAFEQGRVLLTLAVGDVREMLDALPTAAPGAADAVYLDGFSPSCNPQMWEMATLQRVVPHCKPGTRLATYTVSSQVRRDLQALGFEVSKQPGLPPKKERLEGVFK
jgi:tRNA U34 5-methylaminomethyl-2-thiouridine-forming methyltransferase MnmC